MNTTESIALTAIQDLLLPVIAQFKGQHSTIVDDGTALGLAIVNEINNVLFPLKHAQEIEHFEVMWAYYPGDGSAGSRDFIVSVTVRRAAEIQDQLVFDLIPDSEEVEAADPVEDNQLYDVEIRALNGQLVNKLEKVKIAELQKNEVYLKYAADKEFSVTVALSPPAPPVPQQ